MRNNECVFLFCDYSILQTHGQHALRGRAMGTRGGAPVPSARPGHRPHEAIPEEGERAAGDGQGGLRRFDGQLEALVPLRAVGGHPR